MQIVYLSVKYITSWSSVKFSQRVVKVSFFCSFLPWFEVFYSFLNILAEITNRSDNNDVTVMLRAAYIQDVPSPGVPVTIVAQQEVCTQDFQ